MNPENTNEADSFIPIDEVAKKLHVTPHTLQRWVRGEVIPKHTYLKVGNTYRFNYNAVVNALRASTTATTVGPVQLEMNFDNPNKDK